MRHVRFLLVGLVALAASVAGIPFLPALISPGSPVGATTFPATEDTYIKDTKPNRVYGARSTLQADTAPNVKRILTRFQVTGIPAGASIVSATLRIFVVDGSPHAGEVHTVVGAWSEGATTWSNAPALGEKTADLSAPALVGTWSEADVSASVIGNGDVDFYVVTPSEDGVDYRSTEGGAEVPILVVQWSEPETFTPAPTPVLTPSPVPTTSPSPTVTPTPIPTTTVDQLHLSWTGDPAITMTIMWHSLTSANPAEVQYGPDTGYGSVASGTTVPSTGEGYLHTVTLTGLTPGATYHYRVSGDDGLWSADHSFQTAPPDDGDFRFLAAADMGPI